MLRPQGTGADMAVPRIHKGKQPRRPHYIPEWAEKYGFNTQAELVKELGIDKSVVSRWYKGSSPAEDHQRALAALFQCEREDLFRHPNDDWMAKFFRNRSEEEFQRIKQMLEAAFPPKTSRSA